MPRPLFTPGKDSVPNVQEAAGQVRKISPPPGFDPRTVQPVASRYTYWAIPAHTAPKYVYIIKRSMKYFVVWQQCKVNPLLYIHSNTEHFQTVFSSVWS